MDFEKITLGVFDFIGNLDFTSLGKVLLLLFVVFWLVIVGWVWIDSGERTSKTYARVIYVLITLLLNIPGLIIYLIVRPSETIEEIYWEDLERRYLKYETAELGDCPKCGNQIYPGYVFCPDCGYELKIKCPNCEVLINKGEKYCSYCGFQVNTRSKKDEEYPSVEIMQQQILASKEEAAETVESNRVRYKSGKSLVVKLGDTVISGWAIATNFVKDLGRKEVAKSEPVKEEIKVENKKSDTKDSKKKSKKKKKNKRK